MSNFLNKNPQSPEIILGPTSVPLNRTYGTNFSSFSIGGFKEVFSVDELYYTVPNNTFGQINYSGNSIPITFFKGSGTSFSFDTITLNSDNISSGRRKLGMMVYSYEENQLYQYIIDGYETLWNNALISSGFGGPTVIISNYGTLVKANSPAGISFISAWTSNAIEGVSGNTASNSVWKKYNPINSLSGVCFTNIDVQNLSSCDVSGITLNNDIIPISDNTINLGSIPKRFREINTVSGTSTIWSATTRVYTPEIDLGLDSLGNSRIITANNSIIQNDLLNGGAF